MAWRHPRGVVAQIDRATTATARATSTCRLPRVADAPATDRLRRALRHRGNVPHAHGAEPWPQALHRRTHPTTALRISEYQALTARRAGSRDPYGRNSRRCGNNGASSRAFLLLSPSPLGRGGRGPDFVMRQGRLANLDLADGLERGLAATRCDAIPGAQNSTAASARIPSPGLSQGRGRTRSAGGR